MAGMVISIGAAPHDPLRRSARRRKNRRPAREFYLRARSRADVRDRVTCAHHARARDPDKLPFGGCSTRGFARKKLRQTSFTARARDPWSMSTPRVAVRYGNGEQRPSTDNGAGSRGTRDAENEHARGITRLRAQPPSTRDDRADDGRRSGTAARQQQRWRILPPPGEFPANWRTGWNWGALSLRI